MTSRPLEVVVAGGGIAGMATALGLADRGHAVRLLEKRPFLGGRVYSFHDAALDRGLDNGQHALLGCYRETLTFLERIGALGRLHWLGLRMEMREAGRRGVLNAGRTPAPLHVPRALLGYGLLSRGEQLRAMVGAARLLARWKRSPERLYRQTVRTVLAELGQSESLCRRLWDPIAVAALNVDPSRACAALFAAVIERAFFGRARDASIVLPAAPLSEVFGGPGAKALGDTGVTLYPRAALARVNLDDEGRVASVATRDGTTFDCDVVVLAMPPRGVAELFVGSGTARATLGSWVNDLSATVPIVSMHVALENPVDLPDMLGLIGTMTQWVFHTDGFRRDGLRGSSLLSCVTSDAAHLGELGDDAVARRLSEDLEALVPELGRVDPKRVHVVREKHATIAATVEATAARPSTRTAVPGLFLAGDWVRTGLPATIESAAVSARAAVEAVGAFEPVPGVVSRPGRAA